MAAAILLAAAVVAWMVLADWYDAVPPGTQAAYVGAATCAKCHATQTAAWQGSDHERAMDRPTAESVVGDFADQTLEHHGVRWTMFRRGEEYGFRVAGGEEPPRELLVRYTFGVRPLQQYLVDGEHGRLQALPIAWDTVQKKWFHLHPHEPITPSDPLHWTGSLATWNHMCAACHSTDVRKGFDVATGKYHTTFHEINVNCEACHGPGSIHVDLAERKRFFWDKNLGYGLPVLKQKSPRPQLETCAACHARQQQVVDPQFAPGREFADHFRLALLDEELYYPDGQIKDEVYEYGSFQQSRMFREHVRCTDCHDPHTTKLKRPGNALCTECHVPAKYDTTSHHKHLPSSTGAACVECHMPHRKYMIVDPRRDHSLRIPRPDLSLKLRSPNACTGCHLHPQKATQADDYAKLVDDAQAAGPAREKLEPLDRWAAQQIETWYGPQRRDDPHYGETLYAARRSDPQAEAALIKLTQNRLHVGPIVRATAATLLPNYATDTAAAALESAARDDDPQVRAAAFMALPDAAAQRLAPAALADPRRLVRDTAVRRLLALADWNPSGGVRSLFERAAQEFAVGLAQQSDQAMGHAPLADWHLYNRDVTSAMAALERAIRVQPEVTGPRTKLAQLQQAVGDAAAAKQRLAEEAAIWRRHAQWAPRRAEIHFEHALAEYRAANLPAAHDACRRAWELSPERSVYLLTLAELCEKQNRWPEALRHADELLQRWPNDPEIQSTITRIRQSAGKQPR